MNITRDELNPPAAEPAESQRLTAAQWTVLAAAFLGWMFDGVEIGLFPLASRPALQELLKDIGDADVGFWNGIIVAAFLWGAAMGGLVFGWLGDKIGRVRAMVLSILVYSLFTGAGAFATQAWHMGAFRFLASLGMGGEWAVAVALVVECWPERHRPKLAGAIGAAANVGFLFIGIFAYAFPVMSASDANHAAAATSTGLVGYLTWVIGNPWRRLMLVGAIPAVLALAVSVMVPESERWKASVQSQAAAAEPADGKRRRRWLGPAILLGTLLAVFAWFAISERILGRGFYQQWFPAFRLDGWLHGGLSERIVLFGTLFASLTALVAGNLAGRQPLLRGFGFGLLVLGVLSAVLWPNPWWMLALPCFVVGAMTGTSSVRQIFSAGMKTRTILAIVFASIPLIGTWAAVSGWIPNWVEQMMQAKLVEEQLPDTRLTTMAPGDLGKAIREARQSLPKETWQQIEFQAARSKAGIQIVLAIGAILACYVAPVVGGIWGRRPVYFLLCLLSLISCAYLFRSMNPFDPWFWLMAGVVGGVTAAFYGWLPLYLPELFPTRVRATGQGLSFNFGRILAGFGALQMGTLVRMLGGDYASAGATITLIYLFGLVLIWLAPETKGKPLPE